MRFANLLLVALLGGALVLSTGTGFAQEKKKDESAKKAEPKKEAAKKEEKKAAPPLTAEAVQAATDILRGEADVLWMCIAAFLVFFMQAGFAMVEAGFTRAKNACNILMKNLMDFSVGSLVFWAVGFGLMFGVMSDKGGYFGASHFFLSGMESSDGTVATGAALDGKLVGFWLFQCVFAATAATIVSGGVAERTKFVGYLLYSVVITAFIYPVFGSWCWNGLLPENGKGWLEAAGFLDFAGSTVVHSVGGWAALAGAIMIGPRLGKYNEDGGIRAIPGHSMPMAALGVFILWLGWFGFNPGSTTSLEGMSFARIAVTTNLAAAGGALSAMVTSWIVGGAKKPDLGMSLNGALAGLVAITCPCDIVTNGGAIVIGLIAGVIVYFSVVGLDRCKIDDPVGAVSVHGVCGAWGTLAAGIFGAQGVLDGTGKGSSGLIYGGGVKQLIIQFQGVAACFIWVMATCLVLFGVLKAAGLLRVSPEDEKLGLDLSEHASSAYQMSEIRS